MICDPRGVGVTLQIVGVVASKNTQDLLCSALAGVCDSICRLRGNGALRTAACARTCARKHDSNGAPFHRAGCGAAVQRTARADTAHGKQTIAQQRRRDRPLPHTRRRHGAGQYVPRALSWGVGDGRANAKTMSRGCVQCCRQCRAQAPVKFKPSAAHCIAIAFHSERNDACSGLRLLVRGKALLRW